MLRLLPLSFLMLFFFAAPSFAQLDADAVQLDKLKIPEIQKSVDLCPVYLEPSDPNLPTWSYKGVTYRGSKPDAKDKFFQDADRYAEAASKQRFINNFMLTMSTVWCPVTDQVTPGGMKQWKKLGYTWESCCAFCDENAKEDDFQNGLEKLRARAEQTYKLIGAKYTEGAKSPVEGAIKLPK
ncbi:MAG TPA: hypothetical protein VLD57_03995 [Blastocatellia bacterium]|nr:hypothetical protein [Blastocatellia bacterium]